MLFGESTTQRSGDEHTLAAVLPDTNGHAGGGGTGSSTFYDDAGVDEHQVIMGQVLTQWNDDATLMQLLSFLFEMHTFGDAADVPEDVWEGVARAIFEVENVVLNPLLTSMSNPLGRQALKELVYEWREHGPGSRVYEVSRDLLDKVVEPEIAGQVIPTAIRSLWEYLGMSSRLPWLMWFYFLNSVMWVGVVSAVILVAVINTGDSPTKAVVIVNVASGAVLFLSGVGAIVVGIAVAHHNAVMHGIVNFMEARRLREILPPAGHHESSSSAVTPEGELANVSMSPSINNGHAESVSEQPPAAPVIVSSAGSVPQHFINSGTLISSVGVPSQHRGSGSQHRGSGSRSRLARFTAEDPRLVTSSGMPFHSMLGMSAAASQVGGVERGGVVDVSESIRATIVCNDTALVSHLCALLWKRRLSVVVLEDPKEFAAAMGRLRHDRLRLFLVYAELVSDSLYQLLLPMEETQNLVYFGSNAQAMQRSDIVPKHLIQYGVEDIDMERFISSLLETAPGAAAAQDIIRTGRHFQIPHYNLGRRLGGGAFGNVFEAEMEALGGRCAVKRIYFKPGEGNERLRDSMREVEIMSRLQHPNVVQYLFCRREGNCICIFMELCEGGSLASMIQKRELTADSVKHFLRQIIEAVVYLHSNHIVHRDLKPENVLFRNGQVKLSDFGTAAKFQGSAGDAAHRNVKGTFPFMAPEVLLQEPYGTQCDVWSIGCIAADVLGIPLEHRALGLVELMQFFRQLSPLMAIEVEEDEQTIKDFLELCFCRDPLQRPTPEALLQHVMLKPEDGAVRRHMEMHKGRVVGRPSLGLQSLRSLGFGGAGNDNESEF